MNVAQLKEFLKDLPEDMPVEVLKRVEYPYSSGTGWTGLDTRQYFGNTEVIGDTLYIGDN